jgi:hypothetical protein
MHSAASSKSIFRLLSSRYKKKYLNNGDEINPEFQTLVKIAQALRPHFQFTIESSEFAAA